MNTINSRHSDGISYSRRSTSPDTLRKIKHWACWTCNDPVFEHSYDRRVSFYVQEGTAELSFSNGESLHISAGDMVTIKPNVSAHWTIETPIVNLYCYHDSY